MKRFKQFAIVFTLLAILSSFCACSSNDDSENLKEYILGTWRSYKCVVYAQGEKYDIEVSKNGQYSNDYFEFKFENNGNATVGCWDVDENGMSSWFVNNVTYVIKDDIVELDNGGSVLTLMYDKDVKALYYRYYQSSEGYGYLYMRK